MHWVDGSYLIDQEVVIITTRMYFPILPSCGLFSLLDPC
jgi:hypothetical protein